MHQVTQPLSGVRIVDFCGDIFPILGSKSATKKAIASGRIFLNGQTASSGDYVNKGDQIELRGTGVKKIKKYDIDLDILYEDDHLVIVNKPGGIAVNGNRYKTVENALVGKAQPSQKEDALPRPVATHRIDVPTKGLVLLAKTKTVLTGLGKSFQENKIKKAYIAVVHGKLPERGDIQEPIEDKNARTLFERLETVPSLKFGFLSLVKFIPITGRTHQLRLHAKNIGHLILGDKLYAEDEATLMGKGLFLCAYELEFQHPATNETLRMSIDPPHKFLRLLKREKERFLAKS